SLAVASVFNAKSSISTPVSVGFSPSLRYFMGDQNGDLDEFDGTNALLIDHGGSSPVTLLSITPSQTWTAATHDSLLNSQNEALQIRGKNILAIGDARIRYSSSPAIDFTGISSVALFDDNTFSVFDASTLTGGVEYHVNANVTGSFAIADVNGDGQEDILIGTDNGLYAYNWNGVPLENFPLKALDGGKIAGSPIVVGLSGSSSVGIIFGSTNGQIYGYDGTGKTLNGFPLQTGGVVSSVAFAGNLLAAASTDSSIYVWRVNNILDSSRIVWKGFLADEYHSNFAESVTPLAAKSTELLPTSLAYNWPNPVYSTTTNIRYYLSKPATVAIKIYNMAGELVDQLTGPGVGNVDNEVQWNVSKVQSGVYFAQIRANASGVQKSVIIKIAVVK
ncbi:MAG: T9SS type A sorting domain-containing protein, partial [Bacteroidota bacterium]